MEQIEAYQPAVGYGGKQIRFGTPVYNDLMHFLIEEAYMLDNSKYKDWVELLADDVLITMPVRQTVSRKNGDGRGPLYWIYDTKEEAVFKATRYLGDSAWADDPPSRHRRMITNVRVYETDVEQEYLVQSYLLLQRNTGNQHTFSPFSARRDDILRREGDSWLIAKRNIIVDQAVIGQPNIGFVI